MRAHARFGGDVAEGAVALVEEDLVRAWACTSSGGSSPDGPASMASGLGVDVPAQVVDHDRSSRPSLLTSTHAPPTDHSGPYSGSGLLSPAFGRDVGERSVAVVVVERVAVHAAHEDVLVAVVVVVADGDAGVVAGARQAGLRGDVLEVALAVVLEQAVGVLRRRSSSACGCRRRW
jgi:hypothetical protein